MACRYTYKGKTYSEEEFIEVLAQMHPSDAKEHMPGVSSAPKFPFERTWHEFVLKRMIRYAAENGYDKVAWTTGEQQAERYDLSKKISEVTYNTKTKLLVAYQGDNGFMERTVEPDGIAEIIGKDAAEKLLKSKPYKSGAGNPTHRIEGVDLKVGGEGMKGFYDVIIPTFLNKFGKKFGAKVESDKIATGRLSQKYSIDQDEDSGKFLLIDNADSTQTTFEEYDTREEAEEAIKTLDRDATVGGVKAVHSLPITDEMKESVLTHGMELFQDATEGRPLGSISFSDAHTIIKLSQAKNLSTWFHESSHWYLNQMAKDMAILASIPEGELTPKQKAYRDRGKTVLNWLGVSSFQEIQREHHEKFARGGEAYLMEGKAPTEELKTLFSHFKAWMVSIYKRLTALNVELTPEIRQVFDRAYATEDEIAMAEQDIQPLFEIGLGARAESYQKAIEGARRESREKLNAKLMREVKRTQEGWYKKIRDDFKAQIEAQVNADPLYRAISILQHGVLPDGSQIATDISPMKLNRREVGERANQLPRGTTHKDGIHPDLAANIFGFESGEALIAAMMNAPERTQLIEKMTDDKMAEEYPELLHQPQISEEAVKAVHNKSRSRLLRMELEILAEKFMPVLKDAIRKVARRVPTDKAIREFAEKTIAGKTINEVRPKTFLRAEVKYAKLAGELLAKGDIEGAFNAKSNELLNHELYLAATEAKERMEKNVEKFKDIVRRKDEDIAKTRDMDIVNAARAILADFGLGKKDRTAESYLKQMKQYDPSTHNTITNLISALTGVGKDYSTLSYQEFEEMATAVTALWSLAKTNRQIDIDGQKVSKETIKSELMLQLSEHVMPKSKAYTQAKTSWEKTQMRLLGIKASLRRVGSWVDAMGGGAFKRYLYTPIVEATAKYRVEKVKYTKRFLELLEPIKGSLKQKDILAHELKHKFKDKAELLGAILHTGNESNLSKLLRGRKWGDYDYEGNLDDSRWRAFIQRMYDEGVVTKADMDFVQGVWDMLEEMKPEAQKAHKAMYGFYFSEITAHPVSTPFGEYRGGYMPARVDPLESSDASMRLEESLLSGDNSYSFPTTTRGATFSRIESYAAPLIMDVRLTMQHVDWALRFSIIEPKVKEVGKILFDKEFRAAIDELDKTVVEDMLIPWLQRAASQRIESATKGNGGKALDWVFKQLRRNTGLNIMVGNVINTMQQFTGFSIAAVKVNPKFLRNALFSYVRGPKALAEMVNSHSAFMSTRTGNSLFDIQSQIDELLVDPTKYEKAKDFAQKNGYILQAGAQNIIDLVVWSGAYEQAVTQGLEEKAAVREADEAVRLTQGSFNAEDISRFETGSPFVRAFTMFYSYFNMQANLLTTEFGKVIRDTGLKKGYQQALYVYIMGFAIPAMMSDLIVTAMKGKPIDEDDDDSYLDDLMVKFFASQARTATAMFPGGQVVQAGINAANDKWYDDKISTSPALSMLESATVGNVKNVTRAIEGKDVSTKKATRDFLSLIGLMTGLPVVPLSRLVPEEEK